MSSMPLMPSTSLLWILEDNDDLRLGAAAIAGSVGFLPQGFATLNAAWAATIAATAAPTHVLSDFHLPDGTSLDWLLQLRTRWPACRIVCLSGFIPAAPRAALTAVGITVLDKPCQLSQLFAAWRQEEGAASVTAPLPLPPPVSR